MAQKSETVSTQFTFTVDDLTRFRRFLILGAEGASYKAKQEAMSGDQTLALVRLLDGGRGKEAVAEIVAIAAHGRAAKQDPLVYALALCARRGDSETKRAAFDALPEVCGIPTTLFQFIGYLKQISDGSGFGRGVRSAVSRWYSGKEPKQLAYQTTKFANRNGYTHRDVLRLCHLRPTSEELGFVLRYLVKGLDDASAGYATMAEADVGRFLSAVEAAKVATEEGEVTELIRLHRLAREHVPTQLLNSAVVWEALLESMPMTAMIRNLGKMTSVGLLADGSKAEDMVCTRLRDEAALKRAKVHPITLLIAMKTYSQGRGDKGKLSWTPVRGVVAALDEAFYLSFSLVEPTGKRIVIGLDVSGSMEAYDIPNTPLTAREGAAAMVMLALRTEPQTHVLAFTHTIEPLALHAGMSLEESIQTVHNMPFGATDCAGPMRWAMQNKVQADTFIIYTDCETNSGRNSPADALREYRRVSGVEDARLIVVGMTSSGFTVADPSDAGMLDVVGFDTAVPTLMADFMTGKL